MTKKPNLLFFGIDSLRRDRMSLYGYDRLTTPHIDKYLEKGTVYNHCFSAHIPTTPGYANMLTGLDCFGTNVVALRHEGELAPNIKTLPEILRENGYDTTCVGFKNVSGRGFDRYIDFEGWNAQGDGRAHKAENLNAVAIPELERLAKNDKPFCLFLRHMDPHSPYRAPEPFHKMFYQGNEFDPNNHSLDPVFKFKPFCDYFASWFPQGCTDAEYVCAQYDAEIAYMDSCIQLILQKLKDLGLENDTLVVFSSDHGETLYDHDCYFDHHSMYDNCLVVPFAVRFPGRVPAGKRVDDICTLADVTPTVLEILDIKTDINFDGRSMFSTAFGGTVAHRDEFYITECTWMRKHGWRTPKWKLMVALEPDFHYKPEIELYDLENDPKETINVAEIRPDVIAELRAKMEAHIAKREKETGRTNPMYTNLNWHGMKLGRGFNSSDEAYNTMHIGDPGAAQRLQQR
ncbi:MAG TPA: sulfatase [Oscillospiraceae bacterium]|nr:sulfatase [Oscillospiraceae bacterium]HPS35734.1 sulfatase [Oscillospiraceae bacterium]